MPRYQLKSLITEHGLTLVREEDMRGTSELQCIVPTCHNQATEHTDFDHYRDRAFPIYCVCHVKGHTLRVKEYSNAYSLIECETSMCGYEERVEVALGYKEVGKNDVVSKDEQIHINSDLKTIERILNKCRCGCAIKIKHSHLV